MPERIPLQDFARKLEELQIPRQAWHSLADLFTAFGLLDDPHEHQCPRCDHIWGHNAADINTNEENEKAHTCPRCFVPGIYRRYHRED